MGPIDYLVTTFMIPFLQFSYTRVFPNYGVAIILLTVVVKALFFPLTKKQFESMSATQKIQPQLKALQEKYKGQPEVLQKEMMKLMKDHNANPLGGCLPALIQLPVFIAIFYTIKSEAFTGLMAATGANKGLFSFYLSNLELPDHTMILPIVIGLLTYWSQKMMMVKGGSGSQQQTVMLIVMPLMMFFFCIKMPGGVLIYWAVSQGISALQQLWMVKRPKKHTQQVVPVNA